jgi:hypothetical protein
MPSSFTYVVANDRISFYWGWIIFHSAYEPHIVSHQSVDGQLGGFYFLDYYE